MSAEVARNWEWSEDAAPAVVIFRSAVAVAGEFQNDWDFVFASYYPSYADMVEKRGVFLNRPGGRTGNTLSDIATCGDRVRISNMRFGDSEQHNGDRAGEDALRSSRYFAASYEAVRT